MSAPQPLVFVPRVAPCEDGRGRIFTTALGQFPAARERPTYLRHLHGGPTWAIARPEDTE